jgi:hypothetical protein
MMIQVQLQVFGLGINVIPRQKWTQTGLASGHVTGQHFSADN